MFGEDTSSTNPSQYVPPLNSVSKLFRKLNVAVADSMVAEGKLPFLVGPSRALVREARAGGYQATHHSPAYEAAYHPAYRVVAGGLVPSF